MMPRVLKSPNVLLVVVATLLVCSQAVREAPGGTEGVPVRRPRADEVLRRMSAFLTSAKQFTFHAEINYDRVLDSGHKLQFAAAMDLSVQRPNMFYGDYIGDLNARRFWYNGRTITVLDRDHNVYARVPTASTIDAALDQLAKKYGVSPPLADFAYPDPYAAMTEGVKRRRWIGLHDVDGVDCHHLAFVQENIDWQIWVEDGERPLPRKIVITYKRLPHSPQYVAVLSDWNLAPRLSNGLFVAELPKGAEKIQFLKLKEEIER